MPQKKRRREQESIDTLYRRNYSDVIEYNSTVFPTLMLIATFLFSLTAILGGLAYLGCNTIDVFRRGLPLYLSCTVLSLALYLICRMERMHKYINVLMYLGFSEVFVAATILSVVFSPEQRGTIIMGSFCLMPMCCVDKPWRTSIFIAVFYLQHTILSFICKGYALGVADAINCLSFVILGMFVGIAFVRIKLESFDTKRMLNIEKRTDVLTGLRNRRRLEEAIARSDMPNFLRPAGILMMDVDNFKSYNDKYGHSAGDECLRRLGATLKSFEQRYPLAFYRYGGEEFVAFIYERDEEQLFALAEEIRLAVAKENSGSSLAEITISIGVAFCPKNNTISLEQWIDFADKAAYKAKDLGKNKTVRFSQLPESKQVYGQ